MIFAKLRAAAIWIAGIAIAIAYAMFQKSARETEKRKGVEKARDTERKAVDALTQGLANEVAAVDAARARRRVRARTR